MRATNKGAADEYSTTDYDADDRLRLGRAVREAREAAGDKSRPKFLAKYGTHTSYGINKKSLELLERGQPGVGGPILRAVGRALPGWTEGTPKIILEGGPIPEPPTEALDARPLTLIEQRLMEVYSLLRQMGLTEADATTLAFQVARQLELDQAVLAAAIERQPVPVD